MTVLRRIVVLALYVGALLSPVSAVKRKDHLKGLLDKINYEMEELEVIAAQAELLADIDEVDKVLDKGFLGDTSDLDKTIDRLSSYKHLKAVDLGDVFGDSEDEPSIKKADPKDSAMKLDKVMRGVSGLLSAQAESSFKAQERSDSHEPDEEGLAEAEAEAEFKDRTDVLAEAEAEIEDRAGVIAEAEENDWKDASAEAEAEIEDRADVDVATEIEAKEKYHVVAEAAIENRADPLQDAEAEVEINDRADDLSEANPAAVDIFASPEAERRGDFSREDPTDENRNRFKIWIVAFVVVVLLCLLAGFHFDSRRLLIHRLVGFPSAPGSWRKRRKDGPRYSRVRDCEL